MGRTIVSVRVLPFGLSLSPMVFTKILRTVLKWARRRGIRLAAYLDDLLVVARSQHTSQIHTRAVLRKLQELGFAIKTSKSTLTPSQRIQHLGFMIDSNTMTLSATHHKVRDLRREAGRLARRQQCTVRQLSSFIRKAQALTMAVFPARLKCRSLLTIKNQMLHQGHQWSSTIRLPPSALQELCCWQDKLLMWNGQTFLPTTPHQELYTDASNTG